MDQNARDQHMEMTQLKIDQEASKAQNREATDISVTSTQAPSQDIYSPGPSHNNSIPATNQNGITSVPSDCEKSIDDLIFKEFKQWMHFDEEQKPWKKLLLTMLVPIIDEYIPIDKTEGKDSRAIQEENNKEIVQKYIKKCLNFLGLNIYLKEAKDEWKTKGTCYYQIIFWCKNNRPKNNHCTCHFKCSFFLTKEFLSKKTWCRNAK